MPRWLRLRLHDVLCNTACVWTKICRQPRSQKWCCLRRCQRDGFYLSRPPAAYCFSCHVFLSLLPLFRYLLLSPISQHSVWSEITSHNSLPLRLNSLLNFPYLNCPALQFRSRIFEFCICQSVVLVCRFPGLRSLLSRRSRHRERLYATGLSICSSVCLSVSLSPKYKNAIFSKTKQI